MTESSFLTMIKDLATTLALLLGGGWALWRWWFEEKLRRSREMASPDGTLQATKVDMGNGKSIVSLQALWRNRGTLPIELCPLHTAVEVFEINNSKSRRRLFLDEGNIVSLVTSAKPEWTAYIMEPNTDSVMQEHFILDNDQIYGFRWLICLGLGAVPGKYKNEHLSCSRELIWSAKDSENQHRKADVPDDGRPT